MHVLPTKCVVQTKLNVDIYAQELLYYTILCVSMCHLYNRKTFSYTSTVARLRRVVLELRLYCVYFLVVRKVISISVPSQNFGLIEDTTIAANPRLIEKGVLKLFLYSQKLAFTEQRLNCY